MEIFSQFSQYFLSVIETGYTYDLWNPACHHVDPETGAAENLVENIGNFPY